MVSRKASEKNRSQGRAGAVKPQMVRHLNRAAVLDLIRQHQPVSRAELARLTGIHRSNIALIVEDLQQFHLLQEEQRKSEGRGRTPTVISLNRDSPGVIGVSLRSAKSTVALASLSGAVESTYIFDTPSEPADFLDALEEACRQVCTTHGSGSSRRRVRQMVISIPGIEMRARGGAATVWMPALPEYSGFQLEAQAAKRCGTETRVANNAGLAAMAVLRSAEKEKGDRINDFVLLVIGDVGVGSGVVIQRSLYRGFDAAYAGEVGHTVIDAKGPRCSCGRRGCLQLYVCDAATWKRYKPQTPFSQARFRDLLQAAAEGQERALSAIRETASYLGIGISNIALTLNPERIVLAGAITSIWPILKNELKAAFFLPYHHALLEAVDTPTDILFLRGAIERAIDLVLRPAE